MRPPRHIVSNCLTLFAKLMKHLSFLIVTLCEEGYVSRMSTLNAQWWRVALVLVLVTVMGCRSSCSRASVSGESNGSPVAVKKTDASLLDSVEELTLENGMRWIFVKRGAAPVFSGVVYVGTGAVDEVPGKSGLAHMFEHMAFKGNTVVGTSDYEKELEFHRRIAEVDAEIATLTAQQSTERVALEKQRRDIELEMKSVVDGTALWSYFQDNGAEVLNAGTSADYTFYYASMPSHRLGLWSYLTSEMVFHPVMREFYSERDVVMEERRQRVENRPSGKLMEALLATAFTVSPYRHMTIGSMEELEGLTIADAKAFHDALYAPSDMVGALVGNFDVEEAKQIVEQFFGRIAKRERKPLVEILDEPVQTAERAVEIEYDAAPGVMIAYHKPTAPHRDDYVFDVIQHLLCSSKSARMRQALVIEQQLTQSVSCTTTFPGTRLNNLMLFLAEPNAGVSPEQLIAAIEVEIATLREELVEDIEIDVARTNLSAALVWGMNSNDGLAQSLAAVELVGGDWRYMTEHAGVLKTITREEVRDVAQRYLQPSQRTVAIRRRAP